MNQTLTELARAWRNGELSKTSTAPEKRRDFVYGKNVGTIVRSGEAVAVDGFSCSLDYAKAYRKMLNGDLAVAVKPGSGAQAVDTIPAGRFGRIQGVRFAVVTFSDTSHNYCDESFASATTGAYRIVARSGYDGQKAVCALKNVGASSSSGLEEVSVVKGATLTGSAGSVSPTYDAALAAASISGTAIGAVELQSLTDSLSGGIAYVSSIECNAEGEVVVNYRYLKIAASAASLSINTSGRQVVTGLVSTPADLSLNLTRVNVLKKGSS